MQRPTAIVFSVLSLTAASVGATPPPPEATFEQEICAATHIFIGTTSNVRFVTGKHGACKGKAAVEGGFLTMCGSAEVDVKIEKVLYPRNWTAPKTVRYQFGGGYFAVENLKRDLEGQRYLLHALAVADEPADVFGPSYPWVLGKSAKDAGKVERALKTCKRQPQRARATDAAGAKR